MRFSLIRIGRVQQEGMDSREYLAQATPTREDDVVRNAALAEETEEALGV